MNKLIPFLLLTLLTGLACDQPGLTPAGRENALLLGNPAADVCDREHVLLEREAYTTYYSHALNAPMWSAWHLNGAWLGSANRSTAGFPPDTTLPAGWYRATEHDYLKTGFDKGHLAPSADRTATVTLNAETFILSNILPQVPNLNRIVWEHLEQYCRDQVGAGQECYIVAGGVSSQGSIAGKINVPAYYWKVVLVLPEGPNDLRRIDATTQAFAVLMPNQDTVSAHEWTYYKVPISRIESLTGFRFFTNLPADVRAQLID